MFWCLIFNQPTLFSRRNLIGIVLGMIAALPTLLTWQFFNLWMDDRGLSSAIIAAFSWMGLPHMIKTFFIPWLSFAPSLPWVHENRWVAWMAFSSFLLSWLLPIFCLIATFDSFSATVIAGIVINILGIIFVKAFGFYQLTQVNPKIRMELVWGQDIGQHIGQSSGQALGLLIAHLYSWEVVYFLCAGVFFIMSIWLMQLSASAYECRHVQSVSTVSSWKDLGQTAWTHVLFLIVCIFMSSGDYLISLFFQLYLRNLGLTYLEIVKYSKLWGLLCYLGGALIAKQLLTEENLQRLPGWCALASLLHAGALVLFIDTQFIQHHLWMAFFLKNLSLGFKGILVHAFIVNYIAVAPSHLTGQLYFLSSIRRSITAAILIDFSTRFLSSHSLTHIIALGSFLSLPAAYLILKIHWESKSWDSSRSSENASTSISS